MSSFAQLLPPNYEAEVMQWIRDDCPAFDVGGYVVGNKEEISHLYCKEDCVVAGIPYANAAVQQLSLSISWEVEEGQQVTLAPSEKKRVIAIVKGPCHKILLAERTMLNILSRASGVATAARRALQIKETMKWHGFVAGTRKTTPGFRSVEKYALIVGGVATHRLDLSQMVMLKDNHIWSTGSITNAVTKARAAAGFSIKIEVECQSVAEAVEAAKAGADIVMLDNCDEVSIHEMARQVKEQFPHVLVEASGGISEDNMHQYMSPYVDIISRGSLTQGYKCMDFSLKIIPQTTSS